MTDQQLMTAALDAAKRAYAPYSGFRVGAALLTASGRIYTGCNIENASYSLTNCAERTAFFKAVSDGERRFAALALVGLPRGKDAVFCPPCGSCRQVMREFCDETFPILLQKADQTIMRLTLGELLPYGFSKEQLD